jgi:hypothetical protein
MNNPLPSGLASVQPGDLAVIHTNTPFGRAMAHSPDGRRYHDLTGDDSAMCPSHSAMFVLNGNGDLCVGDVTFPVAVWQPMAVFEANIQAGVYQNVHLLRVAGSTEAQRAAMAKHWNDNVHNSFYDIFAYPRLILTDEFGWQFATPDGYAFFRYCTEANGESVNCVIPGTYPINPRPLTEIVMLKQGVLEEIT